MTISVTNLSNEIASAVRTYTKEVKEEIETAKNEVSKEFKIDVSRDSPEKTGSYKTGWRIKKEKRSYKIYNKTDYQLTHLLEKSHAKRGGGRTTPKIHIAPNEERAIREFLNRIERAIEPR